MNSKETFVPDYREINRGNLRTGKTFEQMMRCAGRNFQEVFGLTKDMKTFVAVASSIEPSFTKFDQALLSMENYRFQYAKLNPQLTEMEIDLVAVEYAIRAYLLPKERETIIDADLDETFDILKLDKYPELPPNVMELINSTYATQIDDTLLNIGDPFEYVNQHRDRLSTTTVEYAPGDVSAQETIRTLAHAMEQIKEACTMTSWGKPTYATYVDECEEWFDDENPEDYDAKWYRELDRAIGHAIRLSEVVRTPDEMNQAIEAWQAARQIHQQRKFHYKEKGVDVTRPDTVYNTEYGLSPTDGLAKEAFKLINTATHEFSALREYQTSALPKVLYWYLEHIIETIEQPATEPEVAQKYYLAWINYLESIGSDLDEISPYNNFDQFYQIFTNFIATKGIRYIQFLDPDLYQQMERDIRTILQQTIPFKKSTQRADMVVAIYPQTHDLLPKASQDRIVASWSITAHAMPHMNENEIASIWKETIRLLKPGGQATFFPIGHYGNSTIEIETILKKLQEKTPIQFTWEFNKSHDPRFPNDDVLVIMRL